MMFHKKLAWLAITVFVAVAGWRALAQEQFQQAPMLPPAPAYPVDGNEFFAANLGIWYRLVPYGYSGGGFTTPQGNYDPNSPPGYPQQAPVTYGARLTRYPVPGSPCAYLQFEPGDMIISLDNLPIYGPNDVLSHFGQTSMVFVNVRTGLPQTAYATLPPQY